LAPGGKTEGKLVGEYVREGGGVGVPEGLGETDGIGDNVGCGDVVGLIVFVGLGLGCKVGTGEGAGVVGKEVGCETGRPEGSEVGMELGGAVGSAVGSRVGAALGVGVGAAFANLTKLVKLKAFLRTVESTKVILVLCTNDVDGNDADNADIVTNHRTKCAPLPGLNLLCRLAIDSRKQLGGRPRVRGQRLLLANQNPAKTVVDSTGKVQRISVS